MQEIRTKWGDELPYNSYGNFLKRTFSGRIRKISVDGGFTCPNRDGRIAYGGCTFCDNGAFTPSYCFGKRSISEQIDAGMVFHERRGRGADGYLVYFQSFTNTYADLDELKGLYDEALNHSKVVGLVVGTRPDCVDDEKLDYFARLAQSKFVAIEYGIESTSDDTLRRICRGHDFATAQRAVSQTTSRGIHTGAHFILGLPCEDRDRILAAVDRINALKLDSVKFHQLQILKHTPIAQEWDLHPEDFPSWTSDEYIDLVIELLRRLRPETVVERFVSQTPARYHHTSGWEMLRNDQILSLLEKRMRARGVYQGEKFITL